MNAHKEAFLARQAGTPAMQDGLIETAGLSGDEEVEETVDEEPPPLETPDDAEPDSDVPAGPGVGDEVPYPEDDTIDTLADMTVAELEELADVRGIDYPSHIRKADLIELIASS